MSQLSKQDLKAENQLSFPNNNNGAITPSDLRAFNVDMIDSTVNQTSFDSFSGSVASQFAAATGSVNSSITGSSLITASFNNGTRNLTFTKGDASTFAVNIPDVSGSAAINTGSFATTGSNTFVGQQTIQDNGLGIYGQYPSIALQANAEGSGSQYPNIGIVIDSATYAGPGTIGGFQVSDVPTTQSVALGINTYSSIYGFPNPVPMIYGQGQLTNTGDDTLIGFPAGRIDIWRPTNISGSVNITGSLTNSGNQIINGELILTSSKFFRIGAAQAISTGVVGNGLLIESQGGNLIRNLAGGGNITLQNTQGNVNISGSATTIQEVDFIPFSASLNSRILAITGSGGGTGSIDTGSFATTGSNTFNGDQNISGSIFFPNGTTIRGNASQQTVFNSPISSLLISCSVNAVIAASDLTINATRTDIRGVETIGDMPTTAAGEVYLLGRSGSLIIGNSTQTPSYNALNHLSSSQVNANTNLIFKTNSATPSTIISGSSNIFTNPSSVAAGRAIYVGGSNNIYLGTAPSITGSAASVSGNRPTMNSNIMGNLSGWTINQASNPGTHQYTGNIIHGGNLTFNMLANTGTVIYSNNLNLAANITLNSPSQSIVNTLAGISGSNSLNMQQNTFAGTINYQGPISSSTHTISNNAVNGVLTLNFQSGSRAYSINQNNINGNLTWADNTVFAPTLGSNNQAINNIINGAVSVFNRASASINMNGNNMGGGTIANDLDTSAIPSAISRNIQIVSSILQGGGSNNVYFSGSMVGATVGRQFNANIIVGQSISASLVGDGSGSTMFGTSMLGVGLNTYGTTTIPDAGIFQNGGSAFVGRWNAEDGNKAKTAQTIFAVGTGNSGSAGITRKTGFLIDSGSNSFFEGTLNVSGSTILSGSAFINNLGNGITDVVVTYNTSTGELRKATLPDILSASFDAAEFWSTTTQSGSAGVSGSITFNNSGSVAGISVVNGKDITMSQAGTYNIQFSAQIETSGGADTVYMWFKKNGTNITDSASKAVLANNTAQIMTVNILDEAQANDYYELAYQTLNGNATVLYEGASGNIPAIPSVILTVTQIR